MPRTDTSLRGLVSLAASSPRSHLLSGGAQLPLAAGLCLYGALFTLLTLHHWFSDYTYLVLSDIGGILPPMLAGGLALVAARRSLGQVRTAWCLIAAGCLSWGLGETVWTVYEVGLRVDVPFPSVADIGYLAMLPLIAFGFISLSSQQRRLVRLRPALDGVAIVLAFTAFVWFFVLHPTYAESDVSVLEKVIGGAYPIGDLVLLYALAVAVERQLGFREGTVLVTMFAGIMLLIGADVGFAFLTLRDQYDGYSLVNLGWPYGFLVIAYAAALGAGWSLGFSEDENPDLRDARARNALPIALLPPMVGLVVVAFLYEPLTTSIPLVVMTALATVAVLGRFAINRGMVSEGARSRQMLLVLLHHRNRRAAA